MHSGKEEEEDDEDDFLDDILEEKREDKREEKGEEEEEEEEEDTWEGDTFEKEVKRMGEIEDSGRFSSSPYKYVSIPRREGKTMGSIRLMKEISLMCEKGEK